MNYMESGMKTYKELKIKEQIKPGIQNQMEHWDGIWDKQL